jgi:hypothetical protein
MRMKNEAKEQKDVLKIHLNRACSRYQVPGSTTLLPRGKCYVEFFEENDTKNNVCTPYKVQNAKI